MASPHILHSSTLPPDPELEKNLMCYCIGLTGHPEPTLSLYPLLPDMRRQGCARLGFVLFCLCHLYGPPFYQRACLLQDVTTSDFCPPKFLDNQYFSTHFFFPLINKQRNLYHHYNKLKNNKIRAFPFPLSFLPSFLFSKWKSINFNFVMTDSPPNLLSPGFHPSTPCPPHQERLQEP